MEGQENKKVVYLYRRLPHLTSFDVRFKKFAFHINYFFLGGGGKQMAVTFDRTPIRDSMALHSALGAPVSRFKVTGG